MATSDVDIGESSSPTKHVATNSISEDSETKELQRIVLNTSTGTEISPATAANQTTAQATLTAIDGHVDGIEGLLGTTNATLAAATPAGANVIGKVTTDVSSPGTTDRVSSKTIVYSDTSLTVDTTAYAAGDVLVSTVVLTAFLRSTSGVAAELRSLTLLDPDKVLTDCKIFFLSANSNMGARNAAEAMVDANAVNIMGVIPIVALDWIPLASCQIVNKNGIGMAIRGVGVTSSCYVAIVNGAGTPTFTTGTLNLRCGFAID